MECGNQVGSNNDGDDDFGDGEMSVSQMMTEFLMGRHNRDMGVTTAWAGFFCTGVIRRRKVLLHQM